jgi:hypothetical protein
MVSKKNLNRIKELKEEIPYYVALSTSDSKEKDFYKKLVVEYEKELETLEKKLVSKGVKSKGICEMSSFLGRPILTVSIDLTYTNRNLYDSIRKSWLNVSDERCQKLVAERGYVVGVINKVVMGVILVEKFEKLEKRANELSERVGFSGKLLDDHPAVGMIMEKRTVSGPIQGFNFEGFDFKD